MLRIEEIMKTKNFDDKHSRHASIDLVKGMSIIRWTWKDHYNMIQSKRVWEITTIKGWHPCNYTNTHNYLGWKRPRIGAFMKLTWSGCQTTTKTSEI